MALRQDQHPLEKIGLELDVDARELRLHGRPLRPSLTRKQFEIITLLWQRRGGAVSLRDIARQCWGEPEKPDANQEIHTYAHRIRTTLRQAGLHADILQNVRGFGYKLDLDPLGSAATAQPQ
jgi:DNA-binding response OmpR family regulator